jgi:hypothetical protein
MTAEQRRSDMVSYSKMSKKAQKEYNSQRRVTWEFSPVSRVKSSKKVYNRKRRKTMTKLILNECFGGYGWSNKATLEYVRRKGLNATFHCTKRENDKLVYPEITEEQYLAQDDATSKTYIYDAHIRVDGKEITSHDIARDDPIAIQLLEEFGTEFCSGRYAELYICGYDETKYVAHIDEYDGFESLMLEPIFTEEMVRACSSIDEVVDLIKSLDLFKGENRHEN